MPNIELLVTHVIIALTLSVLISGTMSTIFKRIETAKGGALNGNQKLLLTVVVSVVVSFGYTMYYAGLPFTQSIAIFVIVALGPQAFYEVFVDAKQQKMPIVQLDGKKVVERTGKVK